MEPTATDQRRTTAREIREEVVRLRSQVLEDSGAIFASWEPRIRREEFAPSALNLARYIALRRHELRGLQLELMPLGLSSLGRCEAQVIESLDAVLAALARFEASEDTVDATSSDTFFRGHDLLREATESALGPTPANRAVRIMVTMPSEAAEDYGLVRALVARGMDVARINCAHDDFDEWRRIAEHVRRASEEIGRPCRVCMDLSGPRARTASIVAPGDPRLTVEDRLLLRADDASPGGGEFSAEFSSSLDGLVEQVKPGHSVWIDEGSLGAAVERRTERGLILRVTDSPPKGARVREDKGLNFPDSELRLDALTEKDRRDLEAVLELADIVGYSFVQRPDDIERLQDELEVRSNPARRLALMIKVETGLAIANLPELIVQGAGRQPLAVMIARGDLAVEIGYLRLAEIQEEILWLCESAHVPVIWATQVLDRFVHKGIEARAEITDAAMAERAECVMLNKGPFVADAVGLLDDLLGRMEGHQFKKVSRLRRLRSW